MSFKLKNRLLSVLLIGIIASPSAMCMDGVEKDSDDLRYVSFHSLEVEDEKKPLYVPPYGVSDVKVIYNDLLAVDSDRRIEYLQEIIRRNREYYSFSMALCPKGLQEGQKKFLHETLSLIFNNCSEHKNNLLHYAAYYGRLDIFLDIKSCLGSRADTPKEDYYMMLDMQNIYGDTPLHCAINSGNVELVKYILETIFMRKPSHLPEGRRVSEACFIRNNNGFTPVELARYMYNFTADVKKREEYARMVRLFESIPVIMNIVNACERKNYGPFKPRISGLDVLKLKGILNSDNANLRISEDISLLYWVSQWQNEELFNYLQSLGAYDRECLYFIRRSSDTDKLLYMDDPFDEDAMSCL